MGKKLYVGNLPFNTTNDDLVDVFSKMGKVESAKIITDRISGRSKGFAFVEMSSEEESQNAISQLHGSHLYGRPLTVNEARPLTPRLQEMSSNRSRWDRSSNGNRYEKNNRW